MGAFKDLTGLKVNYLVVLHRCNITKPKKNKCVSWVCLCTACNKEYTTTSDRLNHKTRVPVSCGCITSKTNTNIRTKKFEGISGDWWTKRVVRNLRSRGERRKILGVTVTIQYAWELFLKQGRKCALSNVDLVISKKTHENTASIDRIDSNIGYHPNNIQWVHKDVNRMKSVYSEEYFIELCKKIAEHDNNKLSRRISKSKDKENPLSKP